MFTFIKKLIKWFVVYPIAACAAFAFVWVVLDVEPSTQTAEVEQPQVAAIQQPQETYKHKQCRLELHKENPYTKDSFVWDTPGFGTYANGEVWVQYNRKVGDQVFKNLSKIC